MKDYLKLAGIGTLAAAGLIGCNQQKELDPSEMPNIIYIMADDMGYGDIGVYGQDKFATPNLDYLASRGITFTQHYSGSTVSAPSRYCLMTGKHTGHADVRGNKEINPEGQAPMPENTITIAQVLKDAGYTTGIFGKWGLGAPGTVSVPNKMGFDEFFGYNCQRQAHRYYPEHLWKNEEKIEIPENKNGARGKYSHDMIMEEAISFIAGNWNKPFFAYIPVTIPHADLDVPEAALEPFKDRFAERPYTGRYYKSVDKPRATYAAMLTYLDNSIGTIIDALFQLKIDEKTIIIFTSDNGPHKEGGNQPGYFNSNGPYKGFKRDLYEGGIRVPLIVSWPEKIDYDIKTDHVSASWDVMPTICDILNLDPPEGIDGVSYLPTLLGEKQKQHDHLYWEFHERGGIQAVRKGDWKAVKTQVKIEDKGEFELYDLSKDPGERFNIADKHPDVVKEMQELMDESHVSNPDWPFYPGEKRKK